ncbi:hypothetical protein [Rugosimonospora africana]|uniref:Uncharacterized protein n=1 Tax=Rugosimonospora africana TaxID=556532 RepID=A0A8J3QSU0_9ACTN|nr:hypothetical protein [Rugosimonospora africana]GIH16218.1 hypothetical protein Raf01_43900 [Rugosimonospora africana]
MSPSRNPNSRPSSSPSRNRVTPMGDIVAIPLRGAWTGNRGVIHSEREIVRFHASDLWITCVLEFRGRWREQWLPNRYTHLYFHDEAVSFAAGHRPCAECRRDSYQRYRDAWAEGLGVEPPSAVAMNRQLHAERIVRGTHRRRLHDQPWADLPDGAFVVLDPERLDPERLDPERLDPERLGPAALDGGELDPGELDPGELDRGELAGGALSRGTPAVVSGDHLTEWATEGYRTRRRRPRVGTARVITPPSTLAVLRAGYPVQVDDSAR